MGCNRVRFPKRVCLTWEFLNGDRWTTSETPCEQAITQSQPQPNEIVVLLKKKLKRDAMLPQIVQMIKAGKSCEAVSNALAVHRGARLTPRLIAATIDLMPDRGPGTHENHGNAIPSLMAPDAARRNIVG